jgi:hypothetical protein
MLGGRSSKNSVQSAMMISQESSKEINHKYYTISCFLSRYSIRALQKMSPAALDSISSVLILKFWERTQRMMEVYWQGNSYGTPDFFARAKRVYKSHRCICEAVYN